MMRTFSMLGLATAIVALATLNLSGADWPQWRGPDRTGVSKETGLLKAWPKAGLKPLWTFEQAGLGYSGMAVVNGVVYTMGARDKDEFLIAIDATGKELWATKIGPVFDFENAFSRGPNATPTVDGDLVFGLGSQGDLICANKVDGNLVWKKDLPKEMAAEVNPVGGGPKKMGWGYSWSPLVDGDKLIIVPGGPEGLFAALDKKTGKELWRSKTVTDQATYSSPIVATLGGVKQYIHITQDGPVGVSAEDGALLWRAKRTNPYPDVVCPTPICQGDLVYTPIGYNGGCDIDKVTAEGKKFKVTSVYSGQEIGSKVGGVVLVDGYGYGYHEDRAWMCQELATGDIKWQSKGRAKGALKSGGPIAADGLIFTVDDTGVVAAFTANPAGPFTEIGRFKLPQQSKQRKSNGKVWAHSSLSDGKLYVRDQELIFCFPVK